MKNKVIEFSKKEEETPQPTVKQYVQDLYELAEATEIKDKETGKQISIKDFQDLVFQKVDALADLLGYWDSFD